MHPALTRTDHRPWPLPPGAWVARQTWHDVLFAHWPIAGSALRPLVPEPLEIQEFDGTSWVGLLPFRMTGVTARWLPALPWLSAFPEMNLRVYVSHRGRPGIWFVSLDAARAPAVWAARRFFHLPYFRAHMRIRPDGDRIHYHSIREATELAATYWPQGTTFEAVPGTLDHFLAERYCLYTRDTRGQLLTLDIHHRPWPLQRAGAEFDLNTVATSQGIAVGGEPAVLHFSRRLDVIFWPMRPPSPRLRRDSTSL
jgi:uncharacterized protein YqjF (DUF2071 family)